MRISWKFYGTTCEGDRIRRVVDGMSEIEGGMGNFVLALIKHPAHGELEHGLWANVDAFRSVGCAVTGRCRSKAVGMGDEDER